MLIEELNAATIKNINSKDPISAYQERESLFGRGGV